MATFQDITIEQLAKAFKALNTIEKSKLHSLLPNEWFTVQDYKLSEEQKIALDLASEKESSGHSTFYTWDDVEHYATSKKRE